MKGTPGAPRRRRTEKNWRLVGPVSWTFIVSRVSFPRVVRACLHLWPV